MNKQLVPMVSLIKEGYDNVIINEDESVTIELITKFVHRPRANKTTVFFRVQPYEYHLNKKHGNLIKGFKTYVAALKYYNNLIKNNNNDNY